MKFVKWRSVRPARFFVQFSAFVSDGDPLKTEFHSVAPSFFLSESLDIFTIYWLCRYASSTKTNYIFRWELFLAGVVLWRKWMRPWGHEEQTLTFLHAAHPTREQTAEFSKCSTAPRVEADQQGRGRLDNLFYIFFFFIVKKWTTETSCISSIKYCYLQHRWCLLCNPTIHPKGSDTGKHYA